MFKRKPNPIPPAVSGHMGAAVRWGPRRHVHLGDFDADERFAILAAIEAKRAAKAARKAAPEVETGAAEREGTRDAVPAA